jgi:hypothetical protein
LTIGHGVRLAALRFRGSAQAHAERPRLRPDTVALLVIGLAVVVANLPALVGFAHVDPLISRGGLTYGLQRGLLAGRETIDVSNGFNSQAIGHLAVFDLLHLQLPWWNPYEGTGMPLLGETQSAALFPPTLLVAFANGQLYEHVLLELIAGICTYRLLRRVGLAGCAATAGAVAYALNGTFAWFAFAGVNPLAFLPMLLLGIERAFAAAESKRRNGWRLIALAGALTVYAGFPEVEYADLLMVVAWTCWRAGCVRDRGLGRFAFKLALGAVVAILLAAPMLIAMLDYLPHADLGSHNGAALGARHLPFYEVAQLLMPYIYGPLDIAHHPGIWTMVGGYLSTILLLFAGLGLISRGRRGLKLVLGIWALLVFAHMYGEPPLVRNVLRLLPGMSKIQFYRYATASLELPVIVLAALGLDDLERVAGRRLRVVTGAALTVAAVGVIGFLVARPLIESLAVPILHGDAYLKASIVWAALTAAAVAVIALLRQVRLRAALLAVVIIVDAIALFAVPEFSAPRGDHLDSAPVAYLQHHLGAQRFLSLGPIAGNYGSYFRISSLRIDDFPPKDFARFLRRRIDPSLAFVGFQDHGEPSLTYELQRHIAGLRAAGVKYVLTVAKGPGLPPDPRDYHLVFRSRTTRIYRLTGAKPYFGAAGCRVGASTFDSVHLVCWRSTTLIRRETWFVGWSARVNGRPTTIRRYQGVFQAIRVPAGTDTITFDFIPVHMRWALLALAAGCLCLIASLVRRVPRWSSTLSTRQSWPGRRSWRRRRLKTSDGPSEDDEQGSGAHEPVV